jgi:hypothetical protein
VSKFFALVILPPDADIATDEAIRKAVDALAIAHLMNDEWSNHAEAHFDDYYCLPPSYLAYWRREQDTVEEGESLQLLGVGAIEAEDFCLEGDGLHVIAVLTPDGAWHELPAWEIRDAWLQSMLGLIKIYDGCKAVRLLCHC